MNPDSTTRERITYYHSKRDKLLDPPATPADEATAAIYAVAIETAELAIVRADAGREIVKALQR